MTFTAGVALAEVGVEILPGDGLGVGVERDAAGGEAGGVERLAHAGLDQVAERGIDREADRADQRDQRDREEHRRHAAPVAQDRARRTTEGREAAAHHARAPHCRDSLAAITTIAPRYFEAIDMRDMVNQ